MKFLRYGDKGQEKPGVLDAEGNLRDLSGQIDDLSGDVLGRLSDLTADGPLVEGSPRIGTPVAGVGKMVCIGLNYSDHAAEANMTPPDEPMIFMKATSAISGPYDPIELPRGSVSTDWEVELGVVIGKPAKYITADQVMDHVAGFVAVNDVSERDFQIRRSGQFTKGKSCDTFGPVGPWLVTPDEIADPQNVALRLSVNGELMQNGNTRDMIFPIAEAIAHLSQFMSFQPGDIIATGTPAGVGMGMKPPRYLRAGDEVVLEVAGLGQQRMQVVQG
ncbi:fumarylacetoacetate hydrolase family protein [Nioella sediminis]|jgi:2-keto-4-pentenoate hydratase/2-oxohepta-3-ene-1,7-dioic acid hydratase in catechol pathway|uniref:fumarylacetoacetate hydrolase family protein n=1 Tax=Nioella sediminis TaxID=1912092 RepID=UPI0008FCF97B|nr:fumarylacetoacetate hydrolase family protein [Nioella sediminis]TBX27719.1 2-hydroxyhepta-2,4-diene-1,7-dioate isomerase [Roseovarius sp. JS7-11]